ncbi:MAG TPA: methyltransferase domain-containing protein [Thiobacillaceae bacterium]|nr:methyltransferase domain-containing protein [Thiobacillaceae bacterium]
MKPLWMDLTRVAHASASNLLAAVAPSYYLRLTGQTGRGRAEERTSDVADYFLRSFDDYFRQLEVAATDIPAWLAGKTLLEYGPGDVPAVALLMIAYGAEKVWCVDRFPMLRLSEKNVAVLELLLGGLSGSALQRARGCFLRHGDLRSGFDPARIEYRVNASGLSGLRQCADMVYSRAVLEHVNDLQATYADMASALKPAGVAVHLVDLKSHGLHKDNPLDFLVWPEWLWRLMFSHKGVPNRWRRIHHLQAAEGAGLKLTNVQTTSTADPADIRRVRPALAKPFQDLADQEFACLGFWMVAETRA